MIACPTYVLPTGLTVGVRLGESSVVCTTRLHVKGEYRSLYRYLFDSGLSRLAGMNSANEQYCNETTTMEGLDLVTRKLSSESKGCNIYVQICEQNKLEAAKQTSHLLQTAETLCNENSDNSKRQGMVFKKLASQVEKHVFDSLQNDICKGLWVKAAGQVYGTSECKLTKETHCQ